MKLENELRLVYKKLMSVVRHEKAPIDDKWKTFDGFYKDNYQRYYRAKIKWKNYKKVTSESNYKYKPLKSKRTRKREIFTRKVKELGYTKTNTVFTSPSDCMKFHKTAKIIMFDNKRLGTRDIKNILHKKGINRSMTNLSKLHTEGVSLFKPNRLHEWKYKGEYLSLNEISKKENISLPLLKEKTTGRSKFNNLLEAIKYCKKYNPNKNKYLFEGELLYPKEIFAIISKKYKIKESTIRSRFYKYGVDIDKLINKSTSKSAPYRKKIIAKKGKIKLIFESIEGASRSLDAQRSSIQKALKGKVKKVKGYIITHYKIKK